MSTTLVRVPLSLVAALAFHVSMSPPSTSDIDTKSDRPVLCTIARIITPILTKGLFWASTLTDTLVVLMPYVPRTFPTLPSISIPSTGALVSWIQHPIQSGVGLGLALNLPTHLSLSHLVSLPSLPLPTLAGTTLALTGAYMRYTAYQALGRFYACPNLGTGPCVLHGARVQARGHAHALITTGPYAFVRHPGYAGLVLCTVGLVVLQLDTLKASEAGSWVGTSVGTRTVALACAILATVGGLRRIRDEERSLRARFKGEWESWAEKVPYRLIPGLY